MAAMPEESRAEDVEKVLAQEKAVEDRKKRLVADLLKQREAAIKDFDDEAGEARLPSGRQVETKPLGAELRCEVDGGFVWSRTCRTTKELRDEFQRIREDFDTRGWHDEQAGES